MVNTTGEWGFYSIVQIISLFRLTFCLSKFLRWAVAFLHSCRHAKAKLPRKHWTLISIENIAFMILHC